MSKLSDLVAIHVMKWEKITAEEHLRRDPELLMILGEDLHDDFNPEIWVDSDNVEQYSVLRFDPEYVDCFLPDCYINQTFEIICHSDLKDAGFNLQHYPGGFKASFFDDDHYGYAEGVDAASTICKAALRFKGIDVND